MGIESVPSRNEEFQDLERHDLLTGEPRYVEDEIRNSKLAILFGVLALIFTVLGMIFTWVLYSRDRNKVFLWHAIWLIGGILLSLLAIGWAFTASSAVKTGRQPSSALTNIVFILALVFVGYLILETIWLILFRPQHFDYLVGLYTDRALWTNRINSSYDFRRGWRTSRRTLWWVCAWTIAAAVCFMIIAYAARSVVWNRYNMTRFALYVACAFIILASWMILFWVKEGFEYKRALPFDFAPKLLNIMRVVGILGLIFGVLTALNNLIQNKMGYFFTGALNLALLLVAISATGIILRNAKNAAHSDFYGQQNCATTQYSIHEREFDGERWCPVGGKYLPAG